ncbi:hypothetical protein EV363DRAFT_1453155 [Boletus edulis]|nr:hypothetical protein EV363DRAFT_1453155 [Boletus edulis]
MVELVDAPVSLAAVRVLGADATSRAFLDWLIAPHLLTPNLSTFRDVLDTTTAISRALAASGLFRDQSVRIQPAEDGDPAHVDVVYNSSAMARAARQSLEGRLVNLFGHADVLSLNASLGTKTKRAFDASLSFPVTPTLSSRAFLSLIGTERELGAQGGGGREERMALKAGIRQFALGTPTPGNELAAELAWRCIGSLSDDAGISVRQSAGPASKASLLHTYTHDTLNDAVMPTSGSLLRVINELSLASKLDSFVPQPSPGASQTLLGQGNNAFWKTEAHAKKGWSLTQGLASYFITYHAAHDLLVTRVPYTTRISFNLVGLSAYELLDLPAWVVMRDTLTRYNRIDLAPLFRSIHSAVTQPSISVGLGLVYRFDPIRVEVNLGVPLVAAKGEILKRGPQAPRNISTVTCWSNILGLVQRSVTQLLTKQNVFINRAWQPDWSSANFGELRSGTDFDILGAMR